MNLRMGFWLIEWSNEMFISSIFCRRGSWVSIFGVHFKLSSKVMHQNHRNNFELAVLFREDIFHGTFPTLLLTFHSKIQFDVNSVFVLFQIYLGKYSCNSSLSTLHACIRKRAYRYAHISYSFRMRILYDRESKKRRHARYACSQTESWKPRQMFVIL